MTDQPFDLFFSLTKVDEQQRLVYGRATAERPDIAREIMDYESSKPYFQKWSQDAERRSRGKSKGNIREMHEAIAAGKVVEINFNDNERAIDIGTYCSDDSTWQKILDGTLTGFSIGGTAKRFPDRSNPSFRRYTAYPNEISYVDAPCLPDATFTMIKADGTSELRKVGLPVPSDPGSSTNITNGLSLNLPSIDQNLGNSDTPEDGDLNPSAPEVAAVPSGGLVTTIPTVADHPIADGLINPARAVEPITQPRSEPVEKVDALEIAEPIWVKAFTSAVNELVAIRKATDDEKVKQDSLLKATGSRVGIARREDAPLTPQSGYPADPNAYGDPANWFWPCDTLERCTSAIAGFNSGQHRNKYSDREWNVLGRRVASRAGALLGKRYQYSPKDKTIISEEPKQMSDQPSLNKVALAPLVSQISQAINVAVDQIGKDPAAAKDLLMGLLGSLDSEVGAASSLGASPVPQSGGPSSAVVMKVDATPAPAATADTMANAAPPPAVSSTPAPDKATMDKVDALTETVAKLAAIVEKMTAPAATATPVAKSAPAGDLAALLNSILDQPTVDPVIVALTSGDKYALQKAAQLAGADGRPDMEAVMKKVNETATNTLAPVFTQMMLARGYTALTFPPVAQ